MKKYKYVAINMNKKKFKGVFFAMDEEHLRKLLHEQNLFLLSCHVIKDKSPNPFFTLTGKVKLKELTAFCRQFAIMINAGMTIMEALKILKEQSYTGYLKKVLELVYEDINSGKLLSEALKRHNKVFPKFFQNMVYVGEMSSSLDKVLTNLADYYESTEKVRNKTKSALMYPIVLLIMMVGILILMIAFVIPTFKESLSQMDVAMPPLTMSIINISEWCMGNWQTIFLVVVGIIVFIWAFKRTKMGKYYFDMIKMKLPMIRKVQESLLASKFSRGFGLLLNSGMDLVEAMEVMERVLGNAYVEKKFHESTEDVRKGIPLTTALEKQKIFPDMLIQMIKVGEKTASIDEVLLSTCNYFDEQISNTLNALTSLLQPIIMLIMGGTIAILFVAVYSPMLSIMQNLGK